MIKSIIGLILLICLISSCQKKIRDIPIELPTKSVSIFDLTEDMRFLRLGDTLNEESLFSKIQNAYLLDSFIVFGQYGASYSDHGQHLYFDHNGQYLHRFNTNAVVKEGIVFATGFYADENGVYVTDNVRRLMFKIDHRGNLIEFSDVINKASLYLPLSDEITLYSYNLAKPFGLLDDHEYYDFFIYSEKNKQIIDKGVTEVPEWARRNYGDIQLIKSPNSQTLYHCSVADPNYIIYEMTTEYIQEVDRLTFAEGMADVNRLKIGANNMPDPHYYRDENIVTDVFGIQRVGDEVFCMLDRGFGTNYLVRKNITTNESYAVQINWHHMVARDYVLRAKILAYTTDKYLVLFSPATTFKPFYDQNKELLQPYLQNDFSNFNYSDNDVLIFLKFKPEYYDM